jgi:hypothetical protein
MALLAKRIANVAFFATLSCVGPSAPDAVVCQDAITRLCGVPLCSAVSTQLGIVDRCEATLLQRTGCADDAFSFSVPTRTEFLRCRSGLMQSGPQSGNRASCQEIDTFFASCPQVLRFLGASR